MNTTVMNTTIAERVPQIQACLLISLAFVLPLSVAAGTIVVALLIALWLIDGKFNRKIQEIRQNKVALAFIAYFLLNVIGLLWTKDMKWGLHIVGKHWKFLLLPILMTSVRKDHIHFYIEAFIYGMAIALIISYLNLAGLVNFTVSSRVTYNVLVAFAAYLILSRLLFCNLTRRIQGLYILLFISMTINLFITYGRMGWVAYFAMICLILFQYFNRHFLKTILLLAIFLPLSFVLLYTYSTAFQGRVRGTWTGLKHFQVANPASEVVRLTFYINSLEIFESHPVIGVGTGDFPTEYKKMNALNSPQYEEISQPHNNYLLVLVQFGSVGFIVFMSIFYFQIRYSLSGSASDHSSDPILPEVALNHLRLALPIFFLVIMFSDSYLLGYYTTLLFAYFSAFLYKDYNGLQ